ncbi:MAG: hypothetical protein CM15mP81_15750 [Alphaproteobacteria bacterium]|nr:MAG: hypothetical protein CM15mP81_15750 [Alphaproteobacteria bacterium]
MWEKKLYLGFCRSSIPTSGSIKVNGKTPERARSEKDLGMFFNHQHFSHGELFLGKIGMPLEIMGFKKERKGNEKNLLFSKFV